MSEVKQKALLAKQASAKLNTLTTDEKNDALMKMADALIANQDVILAANEKDIQRGEETGIGKALLDRLRLNPERIQSMAQGLRQIVELPDPIGDILEQIERPNGLRIEKVRVPIGLIGMIFEARPNVTVDASGLCLKTGNAVLLRGGSSALYSNQQIVRVLHEALENSAIPKEAVQLVESTDRASVNEMMKLNGILDVIIPRGGASLIQNVIQNSTVPVIETGAGVCHTYIDSDADHDIAMKVALNAKLQRPSVCNAMETLLVHVEYDQDQLKALLEKYKDSGVELRGCPKTRQIASWINPASEEDWSTEYNDYILAVKIVDSLDEAIAHIQKYGTMHSECIITQNNDHAERFLQEVDAAAVYHNASTYFSDGFQFGFGAEIGISTQKLHARGPMGLPALTSYKYKIYGKGHIRV